MRLFHTAVRLSREATLFFSPNVLPIPHTPLNDGFFEITVAPLYRGHKIQIYFTHSGSLACPSMGVICDTHDTMTEVRSFLPFDLSGQPWSPRLVLGGLLQTLQTSNPNLTFGVPFPCVQRTAKSIY